MPTYQYACTTCAEQVEVVQRFSDDPLTVCPACGGTLRKVFSPVGIVFKGSGFYRTDSRQAATAGANGDSARDGKGKGKDGTTKDGKTKETAESGTAANGSPGDAKKPAGAKSSPAVGASSSTH